MKHFKWLTGDVDYLNYGGKWYRKVADTRYHVIELINYWDATGEKDMDKYYVSLSEVDLESPQLKEAIRSCGDEEYDSELMRVDSLASYGAKAPLGNWSGGNANKLLSEAKQESRSLDDPEAYETAMSRPVNALGSTAREYANGDFNSAIMRGIARQDKPAELMGKITHNTSLETLAKSYYNSDGTLRRIAQADIQKCKFTILIPSHYREDGSCKCNDPAEQEKMIKEWGYNEEDFKDIILEGNEYSEADLEENPRLG